MTDTVEIETLDTDGLAAAYEGSWYFIAGAGGDLQQWVNGYGDLFDEAEITRPTRWVQVSGETINRFVEHKKGGTLTRTDAFQPDLTCLLFPLDGMETPKLALFKVRMGDRWFDDVVQNMDVLPR